MTIDVVALASASVRRVPVVAIAAATAFTAALLATAATANGGADELLTVARLSAIVVAASASGAVSDPSAPLANSLWIGRLGRSVFVLVPTFLLVTALWACATWSTRWLGAGVALPVPGLLVELAVLVVVGWSTTAVIAARRGPRGAPLAGATTLMILALGTMTLPRTIEWLWRSPDPGWAVSRARWATIGVAAILALAVTWRDPAR